jgi:hypothetical protein
LISRLAAEFRRDPALWLTGLTSAALLALMNLREAPLFASLSMGRTIPDSDLAATPDNLMALQSYLAGKPETAGVLRSMHLYPDMVLPAVLTVFLFLIIRRLAQGATVYGRPAEKLLSIFLAVPILYGLADYAENALSLAFFPPASPSPALSALLANALFWATRLKFLAVSISAIIVLRLALAQYQR